MKRRLMAGALCAALLAMPLQAFAQTAPAASPSPAGSSLPMALPAPPQPVLPPVPAVAPGYLAPEIGTPDGEIVGVTQQPFVGLALDTAIAMALSKNSDLAVAQANRRIAGFQVAAAEGAYDMRFQVAPSYSHTVTAPTNSFFTGPNAGPITQDTLGANAAFSGLTAAGGTYQIGGSAQRITSDSLVNGFNPYYPSALSFNLTQPLARGAAMNDAKRALQLARIGNETSAANILLTASNTVVSVSDAYWDLVAAWRDVAIQEEGLKQTALQAASNQRLARRGAAAPIDVVESNTQVNVFQDNVFSALQNVARLQNQIKALTLTDPSDPLWLANIVPTSNAGQLPVEPRVDDVIARALANRPEVMQLAQARRSAGVHLAYAREQTKPQIDLQLGYTSNGFAGQPTAPGQNPLNASTGAQISAINALIRNANRTLLPGQQIPLLQGGGAIPPSYLSGALGQSLSNLQNNKFPTYTAQVVLGLPLRDRTAKANYAIALEQQRALDVQQIALIQRLTVEARNALQQLRSARYRLVAARAARAAAQAVRNSEVRKFHAGQSTTFLVLQRELNLASNRGRELQAQTDLNKAVVELDRVTGAILANNHVDATNVGIVTLSGAPAPLASFAPPNPRPTPLP